MDGDNRGVESVPDWVLATGPFLVIGGLVGISAAAVSFFEPGQVDVTGEGQILVVLTAIGFMAGILPVFLGMLWFPYIRRLEAAWIHAVLAFSAGILAFIAFEMGAAAIEHAVDVPTALLGESVVLVGAAGTVLSMEAGSRWRRSRTSGEHAEGLRVAYLIAIGLGLHSVGEGLAIGSAFVLGEQGLVVLLTLGFIIHNVTEGPAVISAVARDASTPPIRHFAALGVLAGGGVIVGGWLGSIADSSLLAAACFAVAFGAITQVIWEMRGLIGSEAGTLLTRRTVAGFVVGVAVMFLLEEIVVETLLIG